MANEITFTNMLGLDFFPPKPAIKEVPDWYKNTPEYITEEGKKKDHKHGTPHTVKKCMPVFDSMTAGYILYTQVDVQVYAGYDKEEGGTFPSYHWPSQDALNFHSIIQNPIHPKGNGTAYPKWVNPYAIKTPPGYSILILPPMHNPNKIFTILEGIVDTDTYLNEINFPFVLNDVKWEGIIEAGTPMAQVIPFKRETWEHRIGSDKERVESNRLEAKLNTKLFNSYKKQFWSRKEFK
jgi:hypothetical protein